MQPDLNALAVFCLVAEERSFRAAAERLGVTRPAVSQAVRKLERDLGTVLLQRTTRSVSLTEAGERLHAGIAPPIAEMRAVTEAAASMDARPTGQLKLAVSSIAERFLAGPMLAAFAAAHPTVQVDVFVTDEEFDIVKEGFDAGVRLGEVIEQDMIAVPVSGDQRQIAVCALAYLARHGEPAHPRELARHRCIGWRRVPNIAPYRWEFTEDGRDFSVDVAPEMTTNDMALMIKLALAGAGIACGMEESFRPWLDRGELVTVLDAFSPPFPGFYLYYPSRRMPPKLRAFVDHLQRSA
jgi:DNA-binding transcriptional LysR family regulator